MEKLQDIRILTFDCYGTLIDWSAGLRQSFVSIFGVDFLRHEREFFDVYVEEEARLEGETYQSYRNVLAASVAAVGRRLGLSVPSNKGILLAESLATWEPFADTNEALKRLKRRFRMGVLSNIDRDLFAFTAKHFGIEFDFLITAEDARSYKPGRAHFERMLSREGPASHVLHVAQSLFHDGVPAQELGLAFAWINRYKQQNDTFVRPTLEVPDLKSLADVLCGD
jgi:2-haloacid dehalogenase